MEIVAVIILVVTFVISITIVNAAYRSFMRLIGANAMFFDVKKKLIAIVVVWLFIAGLVLSLFRII